MRALYMMLSLIFIMGGCSQAATQPQTEPSRQTTNQEQEANKLADKKAAAFTMPETMPDDFDFSLAFGFGSKNVLNTYNNTFTKDLVSAGTATAVLTLTEEELNTIYQMMLDIDIFADKTLVPEIDRCGKTPFHTDNWNITAAGKTISLSWSDKSCELTEDAKELENIRNEIIQMVEQKPEFKELPEAHGAYA